MTEIKEKLKEIALSNETYGKITKIGDKYNLMIDAQGELAAEIRDVIIGFKPAKQFIENIKNRLEIDIDQAAKIAADVNSEIFEVIQDKLKLAQAEYEKGAEQKSEKSAIPSQKPLTPLEKAGEFEIIKDRPVSASPQYNDKNLDKTKILDGIENPPTTPRVSIVDHLLANPVSSTNETVIPKPQTPTPIAATLAPQVSPAPASPKPPVQPAGKPSIDPYREPFE